MKAEIKIGKHYVKALEIIHAGQDASSDSVVVI